MVFTRKYKHFCKKNNNFGFEKFVSVNIQVIRTEICFVNFLKRSIKYYKFIVFFFFFLLKQRTPIVIFRMLA